MGYLRDTVFILRSEPYRESDTRISMYGREHGKHVAVARGSRKLSAKQLGHLEPLTKAEVMIAQGTAFDTLAVARLHAPEGPLRDRLGAMAIGGMLASLVDQMTRPGVRDPDVFSLIEDVLDTLVSLEQVPTRERARLLYAGASFRLLYCLGSGPELKSCLRCRKNLEEPVYSYPSLGGFSCESCSRELRRDGMLGSLLPHNVLRLLRVLARSSMRELVPLGVEIGLIQAAARLIDAFFSHTPIWNGEKTTDRVTVFFE